MANHSTVGPAVARGVAVATRNAMAVLLAATCSVPSFGAGKTPTPLVVAERVTPDASAVARWVVASGDHRGAPFFIIDKTRARLLVFDPQGKLQGTSPVLLGLARGDESVPGIGERKLSDIRPDERTTPAGRFVAEPGRNLNGEDIVWVDYAAAVSLHRVRETQASEHRLQRLATATVADNRISYGCINVPVRFYDTVVQRALRDARHVIIYVLPETKPLREAIRGYVAGPQTTASAG